MISFAAGLFLSFSTAMALSSAIASSQSFNAQDSLPASERKEISADTLNAAIVTARAVQGVSVPQQRLSGEQLQALSTTSVADAMKFFAGVQIKDFGGLGGQKTINVRSLGTQHTGVFIDGIRITNCQNGTVDLGKYSLVNMESVELYNSNKLAPLMTASEYASASTVYLKTKRPESSKLNARYSYGSFNSHKAQLHGSYKDRFFADVEYDHSDGNYPFSYHSEYEDTTGVRKNSDITFVRAEGGYFTDHFSSHIYFYSSDRGLPGGIVRRLSDKFGDIGREKDINTFAQAGYSNSWGEHSLKINGRYAYDYLHVNTDVPENQFVHYNNEYTQQDAYLGLAYSLKYKWMTLSISPDIRYSNLSCNVYGMSYVHRLDFKTVADLRFKYGGFDLDASLLFTNVKDHSKMQTAQSLNRFSPTFFLSYKFNEAFTLRSFYKSIFRAPTLNDLYYTHVGRRNLKPEVTRQLDCGISFNTSGKKEDELNIQLDYYHNSVSDKIICVPNGGAYDWKMMNRGYVVTNGVDLSARYSREHWSAFVTATWQDVRDLTDKEDESSYNHQLLYSPEWSFSAVLSAFYKGFTASLSHMYCSERYWTYASGEDILPQYNCTDIKLQYHRRWMTISLECNDLFDVRYELVQRWPLPGRRFTLGAVFEFKAR